MNNHEQMILYPSGIYIRTEMNSEKEKKIQIIKSWQSSDTSVSFLEFSPETYENCVAFDVNRQKYVTSKRRILQ